MAVKGVQFIVPILEGNDGFIRGDYWRRSFLCDDRIELKITQMNRKWRKRTKRCRKLFGVSDQKYPETVCAC